MKDKESKIITLISNGSKLSQQIEEFLIENKIKYYVLYTDEESKDLPAIFDSISRDPYQGEQRIKLFMHNQKYKKSA